jgi:hypothetical protein
MTLEKDLQQPNTPVWDDRFLFVPAIVEIKKGSDPAVPNWTYFLGFGQRFLLNASELQDGIHYFCIGFTISITCNRDRFVIVLATLAPDAEKKLAALHPPGNVKKLIAAVQQTPLRRYSLSTLIPGKVLPRVVGTIKDADPTTQQLFYSSVESLFSPGGQLPTEFHIRNKDEVLFFASKEYLLTCPLFIVTTHQGCCK